jgi:transcriptional regulator with XRE-family HTH domain
MSSGAGQGSNADLESLGGKLRELRLRRALTLNAVGQQTKLSSSMLSQLERGLVAPSLATLYALAQYYGTHVADLFHENSADDGELVRRGERVVMHLPRSDATYELLGRGRHDLQMFEMIMTAGQSSADHTISHAGEECVLVLQGVVRARVGAREFVLHEGDSLQYSAMLPHTYEVHGGKDARLVVAVTPPVL